MGQGHGQEHYMGFAPEVTYGTPVTPPTLFAEVSSDTLKMERGFTQKPELRNTSNVTRVPNKQKVTGGLSAQMPWDGLGTLLKWALGQVTSVAGTPNVHTIFPHRTLPIFTAYSNRDQAAITGDEVDQWVSCQITKLTLKQDREEPLILSADIVGQKRNKVAALTPSFTLKNVIHWTHLTHVQADANGSGGGPYTIPIRSFELSVENPVYDDHYTLGSAGKTGTSRNGPRKVMMSLEAEYSSDDESDIFDSDAGHDWQIQYDDGANRQLKIDMQNFVINEFDNPVNDSGAILINMSGQADQGTAELDEIIVTLKNATATI